jgi:hypothetical protein
MPLDHTINERTPARISPRKLSRLRVSQPIAPALKDIGRFVSGVRVDSLTDERYLQGQYRFSPNARDTLGKANWPANVHFCTIG